MRFSRTTVKPELFEDSVFDDNYAAAWEVFRMRWQAVPGEEIASSHT